MKLTQKLGLAYYRTNLKILALISPQKAARKALKLFSTPFVKSTSKPAPIFDEGELLTFTLGDILITGNRWNHRAKKKVLIVHGFESGSGNFHQYIAELVRHDFEVLAFDAPAHGRSGGKRITLPDYIKMLNEVIVKYGPIDHYLAHSFGGLTLIHTLETTSTNQFSRIALIAPATESTSAVDRFFRMFHLGKNVRFHFDELIVKKAGVHPSHYSIRRAITNIKAQILWIHDETDKVTPLHDALKVKEDNHANLDFIITTGLGHRRIYRDEKVIKTVIDFLKG
ncbi:MAG TPA: alpha/beta fold hydrolase [Flavitalea sp.]|nr:alpha/beta fold hydrolase [Flavitalea sp.]